jgi:hypothetical protein
MKLDSYNFDKQGSKGVDKAEECLQPVSAYNHGVLTARECLLTARECYSQGVLTARECSQPGVLNSQGVLTARECSQPGSVYSQGVLTARECT